MIIHYYTEGDIPEIKMSGNSIISKDENDLVTLEVQETESSYRYLSIMAKPQLVLKFSLPAFIEIPLGAWCEFMGQTFTLNDPENIRKNGTRNIEYTMTMGTDEDLLGLYKLRNSVDHRLKYSMCATPREFIQEIVANLNERSGGGWSVGTCIESTEKTVEFNHSYIDDALQNIADTFGTEWEIVNKAISLRKVEYFKDNPLSLSYGKGNGFMPGVGRTALSDEKPIKRLYIQGGDRNIDYSKYRSKELLLPKGQILDYEGRRYKTDDDGYYIERLDVISDAVREDSLDLSEIYPSRIGTISSVVVVDAEKNFYDIVDSSIPQELNYENYLIEGETMTIIFQDGMLAGKEFECKYIHEAVTITNPDGTTYTKAARRFEIVPQEIDGIVMPNSTYAPASGGKYIVFGCSLPDSYVCDNVNKIGASWDMFREGVRYLYEHEEQKFTFTGTLQGLWAKQNWENVGGHLKVGGYILFTDTQFAPEGKLIRITGIKEFLTSPYTPTIEISSSISGVTTSSKMKKIDNVDVLIEEMNKNALSFTKRRFRDAKETIEMLNDLMDAGFDNFTNGINPITVQTMSMLVGDESLQFRFVNRKTDPIVEVPAYVSYNQNTKQLTIPQGIVQHMTLGIDTVKASHDPSEYKFWDVAAFTSGRLQDGTKKYYLYIRANRADTDAVFYLSETAHKLTEGDTYYWLLMGVLNSEYDGERSYASLYGFTEVLPGRVTTQKIVSPDGKTYFDLVLGEIGGNIRIKAGSSGLENLAEWAQLAQDLTDMNEAIGVTAGAVDDLSDYVDGAFADGIITEAEAIAIEKYINTVNQTKADVEATYNKLYTNEYLFGTPKTTLLNCKVTLMGSISDLITSINTAIADGKSTTSEKADVDSKFSSFRSALADFNTAVEGANKAIQDALKSYSDAALAKAKDAQNAANAAQASADAAQDAADDLGDYVDGAFADGIITEAEAIAIEKYINTVNQTKADVEATYNKLYTNEYLFGTPKTTLLNCKVTLMGSISDLITSINTAIADGKSTTSEKADVDSKFSSFRSALADFNTAVEGANKAIQDALKSYSDAALAKAKDAQNAANAAQASADAAQDAADDLGDYVDGAFADGIITEAEAIAIQKYINTVNNTKEGVVATYNKLYANTYLEGDAKTGLLNANVTLMGAIDDVISAINTAIADGAATATEKANVDSKFTAFNTALNGFNQAVEIANKAIQDKLKSYSDTVAADLVVANGKIQANASSIDAVNNTINTAGWITKGDGNTWWAKKELEDGNEIISYINQNATTTTINSSKINLVGAVTFSMFNSSLQSDFNGKANSSDLGSLAGKNKVSASDLATALQNTINSKLEQSDLDNDIITFARLGSTIVEGGYIKTSLLNVIKIAAVEGTIAGFKISGNGLTNDPFTNDAYVIFRNDARKSFAGIGGNVLPAATGLRAVARFENEDLNNYWGLGANYAMILSAKNADRNYAFAGSGNGVLNGYIVGCKLNDFTPSRSLNTIDLNKGKYVLVRGTYGTLYLPVLSECRTFLGVGDSTPFAFDLYIAAADGASFTLYGYRSSSSGANCPHMRNPDDYQDMTGGLGMAKGDTAHLMIVYDGRNFNAFIMGNRA